MRINDILSKPISENFEIVDRFLGDKVLGIGKQKKLNVGNILRNYHCNTCNADYTFHSICNLNCIRVDKRLLSIDSVLQCPSCSNKISLWFLIEAENDMESITYNKYRLLCVTEKFTTNVSIIHHDYGEFTTLLQKAEISYRNQLGAAAIVYLRKVYEGITKKVATALGVNIIRPNGSPRPFKEILEEVDKRKHIIPQEYTENGYQLFRELSDIVHNNSNQDEEYGLKKYQSLRILVIGILDNVKKHQEITQAINELGWAQGEAVNE